MSASNANERMVERIDATLPAVPTNSTDRPALEYIRAQLTPERLAARAEAYGGDPGVDHLLAVAKTRLRAYETKETS